jgi:hemoglobin-like flavoprotein
MNRVQLHRVRVSFEWFRPCGPAMVARVLRQLEDRSPGVRALFPRDCSKLNKRFFETLSQVVRRADTWHKLEGPLMELGLQAYRAGANPAHYRIVRAEVLRAMEELAGEDWSPELAADWTLLLEAVSGAMMRGALGDERLAAA